MSERRAGSAGVLLIAGALLAPAWLGACGHCLEDRIAAVYDHAVVLDARQHHRAVMFVGVRGLDPAAPARMTRRLRAALVAVPEVDATSLRIDAAAAAASFEFDPARSPVPRMLDRVRGRLSRAGWECDTLRVMRG